MEEKMRRRHPHLYGDGEAASWETLKRLEGRPGKTPLLSGVSSGLEPLTRALQLQRVAGTVGFDWKAPEGALRKLTEEIEELRSVAQSTDGPSEAIRDELGDVLFSAVNVARLLGISPAEALEASNRKFERRFADVERDVERSGRAWSTFTLEELDHFWDQAKKRE